MYTRFSTVSLALFSLTLAMPAWAKNLSCESGIIEDFYQSRGILRVGAESENAILVRDLRITFSTNPGLNTNLPSSLGRPSDAFVRFFGGESRYCSYRLALPLNHAHRDKTHVHVDASCDDGRFYTFRLECNAAD